MKGFCGECDRRYACDIDPDKCDEWPDLVPMTNADLLMAQDGKSKRDALLTFFAGGRASETAISTTLPALKQLSVSAP